MDSIVSKLRYCRMELIFCSCSFTSAFVYSTENNSRRIKALRLEQVGLGRMITYRLINYGCHYVAENSELKEITEFDSCISGHKHYFAIEIKDETESLERISHELWQVVVKVLVYKLYIGCEICRELL